MNQNLRNNTSIRSETEKVNTFHRIRYPNAGYFFIEENGQIEKVDENKFEWKLYVTDVSIAYNWKHYFEKYNFPRKVVKITRTVITFWEIELGGQWRDSVGNIVSHFYPNAPEIVIIDDHYLTEEEKLDIQGPLRTVDSCEKCGSWIVTQVENIWKCSRCNQK